MIFRRLFLRKKQDALGIADFHLSAFHFLVIWLYAFLGAPTDARAAMALLVAFIEATYACHH